MRALLVVALGVVLCGAQGLRNAAASSPVRDSSHMAAKPNLAGRWQLNNGESEDARVKMREAMRERRPGGFGGPGGRGPRGGGPRTGGPGGGPRGGRPSADGSGGPRAGLREFWEPSQAFTITQGDLELTIDDGESTVLRLYPDGRTTKRESGSVETKAWWNGPELVAQSKMPEGVKLTATYLLVPEKHQLHVTSRLDGWRGRAVTARRVYDAVREE